MIYCCFPVQNVMIFLLCGCERGVEVHDHRVCVECVCVVDRTVCGLVVVMYDESPFRFQLGPLGVGGFHQELQPNFLAICKR